RQCFRNGQRNTGRASGTQWPYAPRTKGTEEDGSPSYLQMNTELRQGLLELYDDVAADVAKAAPVCDLSGRCCRFKEYGHTLFISRPEADLLLEQGLPADARIDEAECPFQQNGLCTARERRPLGCRIY